jgi:hypothetical protein
VSPTVAFAAVYGLIWVAWAVTDGNGAWAPSWALACPRLHTALILSVCAAPLWATLMLALVDASRRSAHGPKALACGAYAPLVPEEEEREAGWPRSTRTRRSSWAKMRCSRLQRTAPAP